MHILGVVDTIKITKMRSVAGFGEDSNEPSLSVKRRKFLDTLYDCRLI